MKYEKVGFDNEYFLEFHIFNGYFSLEPRKRFLDVVIFFKTYFVGIENLLCG